MCLFSACKQFEIQDLDTTKNSYRIKKIIQYNDLGEELNRDVFNYKNEQLVLWQWFYKNENGEMTQSRKVDVQYKGVNIVKTLSYLKNDKWIYHQEVNYTVCNNLIYEKMVSRLVFPECNECWKYSYKYKESKLVEWNKYIKTETNDWMHIRKNTFTYNNNKLIETKDSVNFNNTEMMLDYKKIYVYKNGQISEWMGGLCTNSCEWKPSQKVAYSYEQNNISTKTYSVWDSTNETWKYFGLENYYYDENNYLIEETTSSGMRILYEYEKGHGNTALIYCEPEDINPPDPMLKSTPIIREHFIND